MHVVHKPIFHSCLVNSNIDYILDIFSGNRNIFITYEELIETYRKAFDYFFYLKIRAAVPNSWKIILRNYEMDHPIEILQRMDRLPSKIKPSKFIYWTLIEQSYTSNNALKALWEMELKLTMKMEDFSYLWVAFQCVVKPSKLQNFQYRILTRSLTFSVLRNKWNPQINAKCELCHKEEETMYHFFCTCEIS